MDVDSVDSVEGSADFFDSDEVTSPLDKPLWFGREVQLSTEKNLKLALLAQFFFSNLQRIEDILNLESGTHRYHLLDFQEEILEEITLNLDQYADFAYLTALYHPLNREFTVLDPKNYQIDIVKCKNYLKAGVKSGLKAIGKGAKKIEKVGKKAGKGITKVAKDIVHFVKEHPKEVAIGALAIGAGIGVGYLLGSLAQAASVVAAGAGAAAQGSGRRREDERDPEPNDPVDIAPLPPNKDPAPLSSFLSEQEKAHIEKSNPLSGLSVGVSPPRGISEPNISSPFQNGSSSMEFFGRNTEGKSNPLIHGMAPSYSVPPSTSSPQETSRFQSVISGFLETVGKGINKIIPRPIEDCKEGVRNAKLFFGSPRSCHIETEGIKYSNMRIGFINGMNTTLEEDQSHLEHIRKLAGGMRIEGVYNHSNTALADGLEIFFLNYQGFAPVTASLLIENWTQFHEENLNNPDAKYFQIAHSMGTIITRDALDRAPQEIRDRIIVVSVGPAVVIPKELCYESIPYASKNDVIHLGENLFAYIVSGAFSNDDAQSLERYAKLVEGKQQLILLEQHPESEGMGHSFQDPTFDDKLGDRIRNYINNDGEYK